MNAGGHGAETQDVIVRARVFDIRDGRALDLDRADLDLGYRRSAISSARGASALALNIYDPALSADRDAASIENNTVEVV